MAKRKTSIRDSWSNAKVIIYCMSLRCRDAIDIIDTFQISMQFSLFRFFSLPLRRVFFVFVYSTLPFFWPLSLVFPTILLFSFSTFFLFYVKRFSIVWLFLCSTILLWAAFFSATCLNRCILLHAPQHFESKSSMWMYVHAGILQRSCIAKVRRQTEIRARWIKMQSEKLYRTASM